MSNYKQTTADGTAYTRARTVLIHNDLEHKAIEFQEEDVAIMGDKTIRQQSGMVVEDFHEHNAATSFSLLDADGVDTGATVTYMEVYGILHSLYIHLATARDAEEAAQAAIAAEIAALEYAALQEQGLTGE